jgi:hypothetical protein
MKKPPIDELFFELYGYYPEKAGQGFEMLVAAALKLLAGRDMPYDDTGSEQRDGMRTSTESDDHGGISKITLRMLMHVAEYEQGEFSIVFTDDGYAQLAQQEPEGIEITSEMEEFYDAEGNVAATLDELGDLVSAGTTGEDDFMAIGTWMLIGKYFKYKGRLYGVRGVEYSVPVRVIKYAVVIEGTGHANLFVKSESGEMDKLVKYVDLRTAVFTDGKVETKIQEG